MHGPLIFLAALAFGADPLPQPGWFGLFPRAPINYGRRYLAPVVADGKEPTAYRQEVVYDWLGDDFRQAKAVLARDPEFKTKYTADALKKQGGIDVIVDKRTGWLLPPSGADIREERALIVPLAEDKALIVTRVGHFGDQDMIWLADSFDMAKAAEALTKPPRTEAKRDAEMYRALPKDASWMDILDWSGTPDKVAVKEKRVEGADYNLADGGSIHLTMQDGKLTGVTLTDKDGKTEELLK